MSMGTLLDYLTECARHEVKLDGFAKCYHQLANEADRDGDDRAAQHYRSEAAAWERDCDKQAEKTKAARAQCLQRYMDAAGLGKGRDTAV